MRLLLIAAAVLGSIAFSSAQQQVRKPSTVHLKKGKPSVYITLVRVGRVESASSDDEKDRVWLRLNNNTRWSIRLDMSGSAPEYGEALLYLDRLKDDEIVYRDRCHVCSTNLLHSGRSLVFSVPRSDLAENHSVRVQFSFDWEHRLSVIEPEHYVYFDSSQLAALTK